MSDALRVAVIGAGPAGLYAAAELTRNDARVDVLDRLPCPYGLVRYGVAPDHLKIKSTQIVLRRILDRPEVRFLGGIELGTEIFVDELKAHYDAVLYAVGSSVDRRLGIPGEDLAGSHSATQFVKWYSGHPDSPIDAFRLDARSVVVIGVGNVAVDVTRILAKSVGELHVTDMPDHVLGALGASSVTDIHLVGRRGPAQAKFTPKELRELGELANADVIVDPDELVVDDAGEQALETDKNARTNLELLREWATRSPEGRPRRIHLRFLHSPVALPGTDRVEGVELERNVLDGTGAVKPTGETTVLPAQMVLRSVGYRGVALPGIPFDEDRGVIPHVDGRVQRDGETAAGEYVVGWIKRGPSGVIGTNKSDAMETVASLLADRDALPRAANRDPDAVPVLAAERGATVVTWEGWKAIEAAETALGGAAGRTTVKITDRADLLAAAARPTSRAERHLTAVQTQ